MELKSGKTKKTTKSRSSKKTSKSDSHRNANEIVEQENDYARPRRSGRRDRLKGQRGEKAFGRDKRDSPLRRHPKQGVGGADRDVKSENKKGF
jgi:hypothetical protein